MKILLISANRLQAPFPVYPLGLDHVAASIDARHPVRIADLNVLGRTDALAGVIDGFGPQLIGLSLRNIDNTDTTDPRGFMEDYRKIMAILRRDSRAPVVLGGSGFSLFPAQLLGALGAEFGIVGEGERLNLLIEALETGKSPAGIPGVVLPGDQTCVFPKPSLIPSTVPSEPVVTR